MAAMVSASDAAIGCCYSSCGKYNLYQPLSHLRASDIAPRLCQNHTFSSFSVEYLRKRRGSWVRSSYGEGSGEEQAILSEIRELMGALNGLKEVVDVQHGTEDMKERVKRLLLRVDVIKENARRAIKQEGRAPAYLIATVKALQREHVSLENIVQLAMKDRMAKAGAGCEAISVSVANMPIAAFDFQSSGKDKTSILVGEKDVQTIEQHAYTMISPLALVTQAKATECLNINAFFKFNAARPEKGSSPLAAFREEIERRVMEQLSGNMQSASVYPDVSRTTQVKIMQDHSEGLHNSPFDWTPEKTEMKAMLASLTGNPSPEDIVDKVRVLLGKVATRALDKELKDSFHKIAEKLSLQFEKAQESARNLSLQLQEKDQAINDMENKWRIERQDLNEELTRLKSKLATIRNQRVMECIQYMATERKIQSLKEELFSFNQLSQGADPRIGVPQQSGLLYLREMLVSMVNVHQGNLQNTDPTAKPIFMKSSSTEFFQSFAKSDSAESDAFCGNNGSESASILPGPELAILCEVLASEKKAAALGGFLITMRYLIQKSRQSIKTKDRYSPTPDTSVGSVRFCLHG